MKYYSAILVLLALCFTTHASYDDFLNFSKNKWGFESQEIDLKPLYEKFFDGLSPSEKPTLIAVGGSSGAGKTTYRKKFLDENNVHIHDMDEVMVAFPQYQEDLSMLGTRGAFEKWFPTAQKIVRLFVHYAMECRYSIIYDRSCGTEGSFLDILTAKKKGYTVKLIGFYIEKPIALERVAKRAIEQNRTVTESILSEYRERFSALWPFYLDVVDEAVLYRSEGEVPQKIFSSNREGVVNQDLYSKFLSEGESFSDLFLEKLRS